MAPMIALAHARQGDRLAAKSSGSLSLVRITRCLCVGFGSRSATAERQPANRRDATSKIAAARRPALMPAMR